MTIEAGPARDGGGRWHLTLVPGGPAGSAGHARSPYLAGGRHSGRIVVGNPHRSGLRTAGVDLLDVRRFELAALRCGAWLERRVCSRSERAVLAADPDRRLHELGCLFSVKESVLKAIGGIPRGGRFTDISVGPPRRGQAGRARLTGQVARRAEALGVDVLTGALPVRDDLVLSWALAVDTAGGARR